MAVSGFTVDNRQGIRIVDLALRKLGVIALGSSVATTPAILSECLLELDSLMFEYQALGMEVFLRAEYLLTVVNGQSSYSIGAAPNPSDPTFVPDVNLPYPRFIYDITVEVPPNFTKIKMNQLPIVNFNQLPLAATGTPVNYTYQPFVDNGTLRIWPTPDASVPAGTQLRIIYQRPINTVNDGLETYDFPNEWQNALVYGLALQLADNYGIPEQKKQWLQQQQAKHLDVALNWANEQGSVYLQPDWRNFPYYQ